MNNIDGGFKSFLCYISVKAHFKSKTYNINDGLLSKSKFINSWNDKHFNSDGKLYYAIEQAYPNKMELIYLYSIYQWYNKDFFVTDIINDKFQLWIKHKKDLLNIRNTFDNDLTIIMEYCIDHNIKLKQLLSSPEILRIKISPFSLCILDSLFKLTDITNFSVSNLEKGKLTEKLFMLDKLSNICYSKFKDIDWKEIIKSKLEKG